MRLAYSSSFEQRVQPVMVVLVKIAIALIAFAFLWKYLLKILAFNWPFIGSVYSPLTGGVRHATLSDGTFVTVSVNTNGGYSIVYENMTSPIAVSKAYVVFGKLVATGVDGTSITAP